MMLKKIRSLHVGWILVILGVGSSYAGISMTDKTSNGITLVCFDSGCVTTQGYSCIALGILMILLGIYKRYIQYS